MQLNLPRAFSFIFLLISSIVRAQSGCFEIESILVNSCAPSASNGEGKNEMLRFRVGDQALNTASFTVAWGNSNVFWNGLLQNATTAQKTASLNATITSCGYLVEPTNGDLPAHAQVLLVTSYNVSATTGFFAQLSDTLYILYANDNSNTGHFLNYVNNPNPDAQTTTISFVDVIGCSDVVTYYRSQLITTAGNIGDEDGASVSFTANGTPTYFNNGCVAPYIPLSANWNAPLVCEQTPPIDLNTLITGTPGGTWSGPGVSGSVFDPSGLNGSVAITYQVGAGACSQVSTLNIPIQPVVSPTWQAPAILCNTAGWVDLNQYITGTSGGTWSGTGVIGSSLNVAAVSGNVSISYSVGVSACAQVESHIIFVQALNANWTNPGPICSSSGVLNLASYAPAGSTGTWSGNGVSGDQFDVSGLSGTFPITYSASANGCSISNTQSLVVEASLSAAWTNPGFLCDTSVVVDLASLITGNTGGTWSGTGVQSAQFDPAVIVDSSSVTYAVSGIVCQASSTQIIYAGTLSSPVIIGDWELCSNETPTALFCDSIPATTVSWFIYPDFSQPVATGNSYIPSAQTTTYYLVRSNQACNSDTTQALFTLYTAPAQPVISNQFDVCENAAIPALQSASFDSVTWFSDALATQVISTGLNYQPSSVGTFYLHASNAHCSSNLQTVTLTQIPLPVVQLTVVGDSVICHTSSVTLAANATAPITWSTGAQSDSIFVSTPGTYTVSTSNICGAMSQSKTIVDITPDASFSLSTYSGAAPLNVSLTTAAANCDWFLNGNAYQWSQNQEEFTEAGVFTFMQRCDNAGCIDTFYRQVEVSNEQFLLEIPNSFTPNGDGFNDQWKWKINGVHSIQTIVFDRWGQEVLEWKSASANWDGSANGNPVPDGVYFFVVRGKDIKDKDFEQNGSVTILRAN